MSLPHVYPDAESMCIQRSIHGVGRNSLRRRDTGSADEADGASHQRGRKPLQRRDSKWGKVASVVKATDFVVNMAEPRGSHNSWITSTFKKKECVRFVADPKKENVCCCGRLPRKHCKDADLSGQGGVHPKWDPDLDVREYPTDANGQITFQNSGANPKPVKYVRVSNQTDPKLVLEILTKYWKLSIPQLVISVTGGAKNFKLNSQDQATFNRGLIKAIRTIAVWVISGGTNVGVRKVVGTAIREARAMSSISKNTIPKFALLGIAPWSYVAGTERLINEENEEVRCVSYKVDPEEKRGQPAPLNPDHTHFVLIDCGRRNKYGDTTELKSRIHEYMLLPTSEGGLGVPVVNVVLEGGVDTIDNALHAIQCHTPVILCDGTGRAADILAYADRHSEEINGIRQLSPACLPILREKIHVLMSIPHNDERMEELVTKINQTMVNKQLLTVFEMQRGEHADLDLAILTALLKLQAVTPLNQLSLALSWNRVDVAESKIFTDDFALPMNMLHPFITEALVSDRVDFLRLFIERGAIVKDYLTVARLRRLYNSAPDSCHLRTLLDDVLRRKPGQPIFLHDIGVLIKHLVGAHYEPLYSHDRHYRQTNKETRALVVLSTSLTGMGMLHLAQEEYMQTQAYRSGVTTGAPRLSMVELANPGMHFDHPFRELFIWAVLMDRPEMGAFLWEQVDDPLSSAIAASSVLTSMSERLLKLSYNPEDYMPHARKFEQLAVDVLEESYETNEELAEKLVRFSQTRWNKSLIEIAAETHDMDFISHPCCQGLIHNIWMGGLLARDINIFLTLFFPFLIPLLIRFKNEDEEDQGKFSGIVGKFITYFKAPITAFYRFLLAYVLFLLFYSAFIMFYIRPTPSIMEYAVFAWIITMSIEELREALIGNEGISVKQRFKIWFKSNWNKFDIVLLAVAILAFGLHWYPPAYEVCRSLYAIDCMLFYVRALRMYAASTRLGPKMVMIWKMMIQMLMFLCILAIFLLGYGVASQSLLYPNQEPSWFSIRNVFIVPYFQIYGELYLEAIQHGESDGCGQEGADPCPTQNMVVLLLLAVYLLIGNVLLLNLLIAIFSRVFEEVQENSLVIWRFEYYFLVMEFKDKPWLPPPLIILVNVYTSLRWLCRLCLRACCQTGLDKAHSKRKEEERNLHLFERECAAQYRRRVADQADENLEQRMGRMEKQLADLSDMLTKRMEKDRDSAASSSTTSNVRPTSKDVHVTHGPLIPGASSQSNELDENEDRSRTRDAGMTSVDQQNALNRAHHHNHSPASILKSSLHAAPRESPPAPMVAPSHQPLSPHDMTAEQMHAFLNFIQQQRLTQSATSSPRGDDGDDESGNYVLEHSIVESPVVPELSVRPPPEGGVVPSSCNRPKTVSRKKRKKKKRSVSPLEPVSDKDGDVSPLSFTSNPKMASPRVAPLEGDPSFPAWYRRSAFATIAEEAEEEEKEGREPQQ